MDVIGQFTVLIRTFLLGHKIVLGQWVEEMQNLDVIGQFTSKTLINQVQVLVPLVEVLVMFQVI